jgi:DNA (cytosine-5)-methyltransferase 1
MENVKGILSFNKGDFFKSLLKEFNSLGYNVQYKICNALDYGLAQARERVFVVGIDKKYKDVVFEFPKENKDVVNTIYNVIGDIEEVGEFEKIGMHNHNIYQNVNSTLYSLLKEGEYLCDVRNGINYVHSWDRDIKGKCSNEEKLILNTILKNRRKKKYGNKDGNPMSLKDIKELVDIENIDIKIQHLVDIGYLQQYIDGKYDIKDRKINIGLKVLDRNTPLTTVTTQMQNIAHYKFPRTLTIRELARIQSFDDDFIFYGNIRNQQIQVGNAVPPLLSYMLANNIFEQFFK